MGTFGWTMMSTSKPDQPFKEAVLLHPFFKGMEHGAALSLFTRCKKVTAARDQTLLKSDKNRTGLYLVIKGEVEVVVKKDTDEVLEVIAEGGIVGLSSLYSFMRKEEVDEGVYASVEVRAKEESLLCLVPYSGLKEYWKEPHLQEFLLTETSRRLQDIYYSLSERVGVSYGLQERSTILKRVKEIMIDNVRSVDSNATVQEAAHIMGTYRVSSVVVLDHSGVAGILTERDIVTRYIAGNIPLTGQVKEGMTASPVVIDQEEYLYEALGKMLEHSIKHLPVTGNGKLVGIVTLYDVMKANHIGTLTSAHKLEDRTFPLDKINAAIESIFHQLWKAHAPVFHILDVMSGLLDRLYRRVLKETEEELLEEGNEKPCSYAFYVMGSAGRREQFMMTDQDHFLVYEKDGGRVESYFRSFSQRLVSKLEEAGLRRCDGDMMSSESAWRGSVSQWEERVRRWSVRSSEDTLLKAQNFFSFRVIDGGEEVQEAFDEALERQLRNTKILLARMAQVEKTKPVPVLHSSIRSLLGMQRKEFSLKKEILFPFHHALQILSLSHGSLFGSTLEKIAFLVKKGSITPGFGEDLKEAFEEIMKLYMELKRNREGDTVQLSTLSTREKESLYHSVKTIREFQNMMLAHYSLA
jgi:CBS domain-containing protein